MRQKPVLQVLALVIVSAIVLVVWAVATREDSTVSDPALFIGKLHDAGVLIKYDCYRHEAQVNLNRWLELNAANKRKITLTLASWCVGQVAGDFIRVIDTQSGQRLAEYHGGTYQVF